MNRLRTVLLLGLVVIAQASRAATVIVSGSLCGSDNSVGDPDATAGTIQDDKFIVQFDHRSIAPDPDSIAGWLSGGTDSNPDWNDYPEAGAPKNLWADSAGLIAPDVDFYAPSPPQSR